MCIPVYPQFIINSAKKIGKNLRILEYARKTNDFMPKKCVLESLSLLKNNKINIKNSHIAVLGLGFRGDVTDSRLSPTFTVVKEFLKKGCKVSVHDPYIFENTQLPKNVLLSNDLHEVIKGASLIFISTDHKRYSKLNDKLLSSTKKPLLIFDGRNILDQNNFKKATILTVGNRL